MLQLTLMRHAKAVPDEGDDFARALADIGREDAPRVARALADAGADPQVVLVSDAKRTQETWALAKAFFPEAQVRLLRSLYLCPAETLMAEADKVAAGRNGAQRVMIVAHNPGLHELASRLAVRKNALESKLRAKLPTAGAAIFERKDVDSSWKLQAFITPKLIND